MRKKEVINTIIVPGTIGLITGLGTAGLVKVMSKREVKKQTKDLQEQIKELKVLVKDTDKYLDKMKIKNDNLDKTTIRRMTPDDLAKIIKAKNKESKIKIINLLEEYTDNRIKNYSDYMMSQIDEAFERLEEAEKYIQSVGDEILGDKAEKVRDKVFSNNEGKENVAKEVLREVDLSKEIEKQIEDNVDQEDSKRKARKKKSE